MIENSHPTQGKKENRLSMRYSLMVWITGAVLGWVVAVISVWTVLNTTDHNTDSNIARNTTIEAQKMEHILPAAGEEKTNKGQ